LKARVAVIGGTGFERLFLKATPLRMRTRYGSVSLLVSSEEIDAKVIFLSRHGANHCIPPHMVDYRANMSALHIAGVERILATNAVGAINTDFKPGDVVVPHDLVDFTKFRPASFCEKAPVTHIDVSKPYCPEVRELLIKNSRKHGLRVWDRAVFACTEGPRFETAAEIEMFRRLGCDIVGMTGFPEPVLARELEMCYATICYVSNMAAGLQEQLTTAELSKISKRILPRVEQVLIDTVKALPLRRGERCSCSRALETARFR